MSESGHDDAHAERGQGDGPPDLAAIGRIGMELLNDIAQAVTAERDTAHWARPRGQRGRFLAQPKPEADPIVEKTRKKLSSTWLKRLLPKNGGLIDAFNALAQTMMKLDERMQRSDRASFGYLPTLSDEEDFERRITAELDRVAARKAADADAEEPRP